MKNEDDVIRVFGVWKEGDLVVYKGQGAQVTSIKMDDMNVSDINGMVPVIYEKLSMLGGYFLVPASELKLRFSKN